VEPLRIRVTASGEVLLNDDPVSLLELDDALKEAKRDEIPVHYCRENAESKATPEAEAVIKLIAANRLRITLSTSDETAAPVERKVVAFPAFENLFAEVRQEATRNRGLSIVRPDGKRLILPPPEAGSIAAQRVKALEAILASKPTRQIAAIAASGAFAGGPDQAPKVTEIARQVPFLGMLIGFSFVGHAVWAFESNPAMLRPGCGSADLLIVDSEALASLPSGWQDEAASAMRNANILVFDRGKEKLGALRTAGEVPGQLAFPA
jgi:hypothetical protein